MKRKYEIVTKQEINQQDDEPIDSVNAALGMLFGDDCEIDWRDESTVWITTSKVIVFEMTEGLVEDL